jgi:glycosyltransferase involved in cell wall biosynthesis
MNILHLNTSDIQGGAARAAYRLHRALLAHGENSKILCQKKISDDENILGATTNIQKALGIIRPVVDSFPVNFYLHKTKTLFTPAIVPFSHISHTVNKLKPDIVHLHWIGGGLVRIEDLAKIKAPIVWSLHDMWAFTGGCHYDECCGKFKIQCGHCPVLSSSYAKDLSFKIFKRKQKTLKKINSLTIVGLSRWIAQCAQESLLFHDKKIINLPNPIDTSEFSPVDKIIARQLLNLPERSKLIVFGAMNATSDPRKGFSELSKALDDLKTQDAELVIFGCSKPQAPVPFKQKTHYLGYLNDNISLRLLYSAANVMVVPSLQENLSNAIMESLACTTPVVGFDIGGNSDMIEHKKNGYLAKPFDTTDLAHGIEWVLNSPNYHLLCHNAREKVVNEFDSKIVALKYIQLYESILAS